MLGDVRINYIEKPYRVVNNNYRNIICLVAPFKDDSFVFKTYNSLKEAVNGEKTLDDNALGYHYLELLYEHFPDMPEIVLCNTTTTESGSLDYTLTNEKLANILTELDEVGISFVVIPEELDLPKYVMYKAFYDEQRSKMNFFGLVHQVKPTLMVETDHEGNAIINETLSKLKALFDLFKTGGSWKTITTPLKFFNEELLTMEESVVYHAGLTATHEENISETHYILENIEGNITKCVYGDELFNLINNTGAIAVNYRDKIHKVAQIYNSGTQTWNEQIENTLDLKHERVKALIGNEFRLRLLKLMGKDNDKISYDDFESLARDIRDTYKPSYISGLDWKVDKTGTAKISVPIETKQKNIITTIDVVGTQIIE